MRMFDSVVVACDQGSLDIGTAIRSSLELFRLRVHLYYCVQKRNILDLLAGHVPPGEHVVLCSSGIDPADADAGKPETIQMGFKVVDQVEGQWQTVWFALTPSNVGEHVCLPDRTVLSTGCNTGMAPLARAFLDSGCRAYIGPAGPVDQDALTLSVIGFFYHLLAQGRDANAACSEREAVERARAFDAVYREGTQAFRYYER